MEINLITLVSKSHKKNKIMMKEITNFIDEINNDLLEEDILLKNNVLNSPVDVVYVATGGSEVEFKKILPNLSSPFILLSSNFNNSLAASLEIRTYCAQIGRPMCFLLGNQEELVVALKAVLNVVSSYQKICDTNLGVIGKPSDWLIASKVNKKDVYDVYKIHLIDIKMDELYSLIDTHEIDTNFNRYNEIIMRYKDNPYLEGSLVIYTAIKKLVKKYNLKGLTIRCFDLVKKYKNTACLALALLNEEGIVSACEGDVPSLITMYLIYTLTNRPCFMANPSQINLQDMSITFAHCTVPFNMVSEYELMTHFESDVGIGVKGKMNEGNVCICKINPNIKKDKDLFIFGKIKENLNQKGLCRTQIKVQLEDQDMYFFDKGMFGNHVIITYSNITPYFYPLINLFKNRDI